MSKRGKSTKGPRRPITYYGDVSRAGQRIPIKVKRQLAKEEEECAVNVSFERIIDFDTTRRLEYRRRKFEWKPALHWGQLKLFTSEIEFITHYTRAGTKESRELTIVYAGSSDGRHIPYLAHLFPQHRFLLWDPAPMYAGWKDLPNIEFRQELFTDDTARDIVNRYDSQSLLFISDIRSMPEGFDYANMTPDMDEEIEQDVKEDMRVQKSWCEIMRARGSMLKFRLPYTPGETEYFIGDVHFQAFAAETSSECRLVIDSEQHGYETRMYDHVDYENIMYRFNRCTRVQDLQSFDAITITIAERVRELAPLFDPVPLSYDVLRIVYAVQMYIDAFDPHAKPGEIIFHLINYISSSFQKKYETKKKLHDKHMEHNRAKYVSGNEIL